MTHKEYVREVKDAKCVIIFIHGILGTPDHFLDFVNKVPENISIYNILLDGHGKEVEDFARTSMKKWKEQVGSLIDKLEKSYEQIIIAAHSMGTLFAIQESIEHPDKVKALFLLASPLKVGVKFEAAKYSVRVILNKTEGSKMAMSARRKCSINTSPKIWKYVSWAPRYLELLSEIRRVRKLTNEISVPCYIFQSANDELVSKTATKYMSKNKFIHLEILPDSAHHYYTEDDYAFLLSEFEKIFK